MTELRHLNMIDTLFFLTVNVELQKTMRNFLHISTWFSSIDRWTKGYARLFALLLRIVRLAGDGNPSRSS